MHCRNQTGSPYSRGRTIVRAANSSAPTGMSGLIFLGWYSWPCRPAWAGQPIWTAVPGHLRPGHRDRCAASPSRSWGPTWLRRCAISWTAAFARSPRRVEYHLVGSARL